SWLSVDSTYTAGSGLYAEAQRQTARNAGARPTFLIESRYENEKNGDGSTAQPVEVRSEMYQPLLSGEMGFNYGCNPCWFLGNTGDGNIAYTYAYGASTTGTFGSWKSALESPGSKWASAAGRLFRAIAWPSLVPDTAGTMLTSGNGTGGVILARALD